MKISESFDNFRPISLCNTIYKVLSKALANRLKLIPPHIISEEQTGFVPGRSIFDGIIIAQEVIHSLQQNHKPGMLVKLDIKKVYNKVDWRFLCKCLEAFGFSKQWIDLMFECVSSPRISILINGTPKDFFGISRGLRQGDPISPFLFIIMVETLGKTIDKAHTNNQIKGIKITNGIEPITHQQFADDTMLLGAAKELEARNFKKILTKYSKESGQSLNQAKSEIFFLNTPAQLEIEICIILGYRKGNLPCKYLGLPLDKGQRSKKLWDNILSKVDKKVASWKNKWLSMAGKATLLKTVLSAIPIYQMSCMPLPSGVKEKLDRKLKHFY